MSQNANDVLKGGKGHVVELLFYAFQHQIYGVYRNRTYLLLILRLIKINLPLLLPWKYFHFGLQENPSLPGPRPKYEPHVRQRTTTKYRPSANSMKSAKAAIPDGSNWGPGCDQWQKATSGVTKYRHKISLQLRYWWFYLTGLFLTYVDTFTVESSMDRCFRIKTWIYNFFLKMYWTYLRVF